MYAVFAVEPYNQQALHNALFRFGDLAHITTLFGRREGGETFQIWELGFEVCSRGLIATVLKRLDAWGLNQRVFVELLETDCDELWAAVTAPIPARPSISWCVRRYLSYHPDAWQDYWSAVGFCGVVSQDFLSFTRRYGAISQEQIDSGYARVALKFLGDVRYATPDFPTEAHEVVAIGRLRIDFTRRQYNEAAAVPTVWISRSNRNDDVFPPCRATASAPNLPPA